MALKIILVDFKGTLYNTETKKMYPNWEIIFQLKMFGLEVWLWRRDELGGTERDLRNKIKKKFDKVIISNEKNLELVEDPIESCVISDHKNDIKMAQKAGAKTIWIRQSKYKNSWPEKEPDFMVYSLNEAVAKIGMLMMNKTGVGMPKAPYPEVTRPLLVCFE